MIFKNLTIFICGIGALAAFGVIARRPLRPIDKPKAAGKYGLVAVKTAAVRPSKTELAAFAAG